MFFYKTEFYFLFVSDIIVSRYICPYLEQHSKHVQVFYNIYYVF